MDHHQCRPEKQSEEKERERWTTTTTAGLRGRGLRGREKSDGDLVAGGSLHNHDLELEGPLVLSEDDRVAVHDADNRLVGSDRTERKESVSLGIMVFIRIPSAQAMGIARSCLLRLTPIVGLTIDRRRHIDQS